MGEVGGVPQGEAEEERMHEVMPRSKPVKDKWQKISGGRRK